MFDILPQTLQHWYKNHLSNYFSDIESKIWHPQKIEILDDNRNEIIEKPVYIFKPDNVGENMSIDDKSIGHDGFTIFSNHDTGKIAMMIESTYSAIVEQAMKLFGEKLKTVKSISMDMSATYSLVANNLMPLATQVIDKFHVMKYLYDAVKDVKRKIIKELKASLTKGKKKTAEDKQKLSEIELLNRVRHAITQSPQSWSDETKKTVNQVFEKYDDLKTAYQICQNFKHWYDYKNHIKPTDEIIKDLYRWYEQAKIIEEFKGVIKMILKHEDEIINFFRNGMSNARAERLNGKIERFVSNNYGIKNKDFCLYRIAGYFS